MRWTPGSAEQKSQGGFTLIELLVALTVLLIGITGIMAMYSTSMRSSSYNRHATEAVALGEDKMEELRTEPLASFLGCAPCTDTVNAQGETPTSEDFIYTRSWQVGDPSVAPSIPAPDPTVRNVSVTVSWQERGETVELVFRTQRIP